MTTMAFHVECPASSQLVQFANFPVYTDLCV
jgi:hypothetical protein